MVKKTLFAGFLLFCLAGTSYLALASGAPDNGARDRVARNFIQIPDSAFQPVVVEDLLDDEVYVKLAQDGWNQSEVLQIMSTVMRDKSRAKQHTGYVNYAKQWLPTYGRVPGGDSLYELMDTLRPDIVMNAIRRSGSEDLYDKVYDTIYPYTPPKYRWRNRGRMDADRRPGVFRHAYHNPSAIRVYRIHANNNIKWNPETHQPLLDEHGNYQFQDPDGKQLYTTPDGCGLFRTMDCGRTWKCITDRIPERMGRSRVVSYTSMVDIYDWDHVYAFSGNGKVYETFDGGENWEVVENAGSQWLKRGYATRDSQGSLLFIGCQQNGGNHYWCTNSSTSSVLLSRDEGRNWERIPFSDDLLDVRPETGGRKSAWFRDIVFDPINRDRIYIPASRQILYTDNGFRTDSEGNYDIKRMSFKVYGREGHFADDGTFVGEELRSEGPSFPIAATSPGNLVVNQIPGRQNEMWFAAAIHSQNMSALYLSKDGGKTWQTRHDVPAGINNANSHQNIFGNEAPWGWLGGFGVDYKETDPDQTYIMACSPSSGYSFDGGLTNIHYAWSTVQVSKFTGEGKFNGDGNKYEGEGDGLYYWVACSRHNADNHYVESHVSGRLFRGSDGGTLMNYKTFHQSDSTTHKQCINIGRDMEAMLYYSVRVNEIGDQVMLGNTQDIDAQTYRYGRWGKWRGYEGSEAFINPFTSTCHYSGGQGSGFDATMALSSWNKGWTYVDFFSGSYYLRRRGTSAPANFHRVDNGGSSAINLSGNMDNNTVAEIAFCRTDDHTVLFALTGSGYLMRSDDEGNTWNYILAANGVRARYSGIQSIATNPKDDTKIYLSSQGKLYYFDIEEGLQKEITTTGLPNMTCTSLIFHEGSGDLYWSNFSSGSIYVLSPNADGSYDGGHWKFFLQGYPKGVFNDLQLNYTTQELVLSDYGRGVWVADLEHPADRFFKDGFALKQISYIDSTRTFGIDTKMVIPQYYDYSWEIKEGSGEWTNANNPYQYLRRQLHAGDKVRLTLTLRESPDVSTRSAEFTVGSDLPVRSNYRPGNYITSTGGRLDVGYIDAFESDFTVDFWIKPQGGNGTLMANRVMCTDARRRGQKGWGLWVNGGNLQFWYNPWHTFSENAIPYVRYHREVSGYDSNNIFGKQGEWGNEQYPIIKNCGSLTPGEWQHVAISCTRGTYDPNSLDSPIEGVPGERTIENGQIHIYINGIETASFPRYVPAMSMNTAANFSLFADAWDINHYACSLDELCIWTRALTQQEVRERMFMGNGDDPEGIMVYYDFNGTGEDLSGDREAYAGRTPRKRVSGEITHSPMLIPIDAQHSRYQPTAATEEKTVYTDHADHTLMAISGTDATGQPKAMDLAVYVYDIQTWISEQSNRDPRYYDYVPTSYMIYPFTQAQEGDKLNIEFYCPLMEFDPNRTYRLHAADFSLTSNFWKEVEGSGPVSYNEEHNTLVLEGIPAEEVFNKKLILLVNKPGIELEVEGLSGHAQLLVSDEDSLTVRVHAELLDNLTEPIGSYNIESDKAVLRPMGSLYFVKGKADGEFHVDLSKIPNFNDRETVWLRGADGDERMVPMRIEIINKITPKELGHSVLLGTTTTQAPSDSEGEETTAPGFHGGRMIFGTASDYESLEGSPEMTMMAWIRIDNEEMLSGDHPLVYFRNANPVTNTGIFLSNGNLRVNWNNNQNNCSNFTSGFTFTREDIGRWYHVAMVLTPQRIYIYRNGVSNYWSRSFGRGNFLAPLALGTHNEASTASFCGAIDQVAIWKKALTQEEIFQYMQEHVKIDNPDLVSYINMDSKDDEGRLMDLVTGATGNPLNSAVALDHESVVPFNPLDRMLSAQTQSRDRVIDMNIPVRKAMTHTLATFNGAPHNYQPATNSELDLSRPLCNMFYTVLYSDPTAINTGGTVTLTYRYPTITANDHITLAIRDLGSTKPFVNTVSARSVQQGEASFSVPASQLANASEMMFFLHPEDAARSTVIEMALDGVASYEDAEGVPCLMLNPMNPTFDLHLRVVSATRGVEPNLVIDNAPYATLDRTEVNTSFNRSTHTITIDPNRINRKALNPVVVKMNGAMAQTSDNPELAALKFNVFIEPVVQLTLRNGTGGSESDFVADNQTATLELDVQCLDGYLDRPVEISTTTDLSRSMNTGTGSLLTNRQVSTPLVYQEDGEDHNKGWNFIANPYMSSIRLKKSDNNVTNVEYDPEKLTPFVYQFDSRTQNFMVYDMENYDDNQRLNPMQPYMVKTKSQNAQIVVNTTARQKNITRRTYDSYTFSPDNSIRIELHSGGALNDVAVVSFSDAATNGYVLDEDAPKMMSVNPEAKQVWTTQAGLLAPQISDGEAVPMSINRTSIHTEAVNLGGSLPDHSGDPVLHITMSPSLEQNQFYLVKDYSGDPGDLADNENAYPLFGEEHTAPMERTGDNLYSFTLPSGDELGQYSLVSKKTSTGIGNGLVDNPYSVLVDGESITIDNLEPDMEVAIYNTAGMTLFSTQVSEPTVTLTLPTGVYLVYVRKGGQAFTTKIVVNP